MKRNFVLSFVLAAMFAATFMTSCNSDKKGPTCYSVAGTDTGAHAIFLGTINPGLAPIRDTLVASVSGSNVTIHSAAMGRNLTGTINASDCNKIDLDSVIFGPLDSLKIPSTIVPSGYVVIKNIRAGGTGMITATGATTQINIAKGNTNITSPVNLTNLNGLGLNLKGTFLKTH